MLAGQLRVLLVPTTEGYGHVSRANAIIKALEHECVDYFVLTDRKRADFLVANGVDSSRIDDSFYGIRYVYTGNGKNLNVPLTLGNLALDTPRYVNDYLKVLAKTTGTGRFDLVINDVNLQLNRLPNSKVITPCHYNAPKCEKDHRRIARHAKSVVSEYFVEPLVNAAISVSDRFNMDFRPHHIDYDSVYPPVVAELERSAAEIRGELGIRTNDRLILDGRKNPPLRLYEKFALEHDDVYFLVRSRAPGSGNVRTMDFIAGMINYVNAADLFITDTGFTAISEGVITNTPMLFDDPGTHLEGFKNFTCAVDEGFGKPIDSLEKDLLKSLERKVPWNTKTIASGLPFMVEKILAHAP